ncbi:alpha-(1-2)-phosphatidylinositol mannosyltransferase, partial [Rhodococcus sp. NPDC054953]
VLSDPDQRRALVDVASEVVAEYDWPVVAEQILRVYETVTVGAQPVRVEA